MKKSQISVQGTPVTILENDFISLTDIARRFDAEDPAGYIMNWIRIKETIEFMGTWEVLHNPSFKVVEFDNLLARAGTARFRLSVKQWTAVTDAIGIYSKVGKGGATYAHRDIAIGFCYWISPAFQIYLVKEFQRLKSLENPEWDMRRALAVVNYKLHTGAVQNTADIYQLLVLANMEAYNETLIHYQMGKEDRFYEIEKAAARQLETLYRLNELPPALTESPQIRALPEQSFGNI